MRVKFTIALCALLVLALGASHVQAQSGGFVVLKDDNKVVKYGANQEMGLLQFVYRANGGVIDDASAITIAYGGHTITNPISETDASTLTDETGGAIRLACGEFMCSDIDVTASNHEDTKVGTVTIDLSGHAARPEGGTLTLTGVRTDVSALDVGDTIFANISATEAVGGLTPIGEDRSDSVGGVVSTVAEGVKFEVSNAASRLICNTGTYDHDGDDRNNNEVKDSTEGPGQEQGDNVAATPQVPIGGLPAIKVTEAFNGAFEDDLASYAIPETWIRIQVNDLPAGVTVMWPDTVTSSNDAGIIGVLNLHPDDKAAQAGSAADADPVVAAKALSAARFGFSDDTGAQIVTENAVKTATFTITLTAVGVDPDKVGTGGLATVQAQLIPPVNDDHPAANNLVYNYPLTAKENFLNVTECVTYLLFPYITCGAHADWDTGIAIANTTMDDGVFGVSPGAAAQAGSVTMWAYPSSEKAADGSTSEGYMADANPITLSPSLAAGDSIAVTCSGVTGLAGMQGYAIAKTTFRHGHGMAFVMNTASGAVDAVHGYVALVIPDPEFGGQRAAAEGESLGH